MGLVEEIWKPVIGYEGLYEVSNLGNACELAKAFPEQRLDHRSLSKVRQRKHKQHKNWRIKI